MSGYISLAKAIDIMQRVDDHGQPIPFRMVYCKKDGKLMEVEQAVMTFIPDGKKAAQPKKTIVKRNNSRNIKILPGGNIRKINLAGIMKVNGKQVI